MKWIVLLLAIMVLLLGFNQMSFEEKAKTKIDEIIDRVNDLTTMIFILKREAINSPFEVEITDQNPERKI